MSYDRPRDGQFQKPCPFRQIRKDFDHAINRHLIGVDQALEGVRAQLAEDLETIRQPKPIVKGGAIINQGPLF